MLFEFGGVAGSLPLFCPALVSWSLLTEPPLLEDEPLDIESVEESDEPLDIESLEEPDDPLLLSPGFVGVRILLVWVVPFLLLCEGSVASRVVVALSPGSAEVLSPLLVPPAMAFGMLMASRNAVTGKAFHKLRDFMSFSLVKRLLMVSA